MQFTINLLRLLLGLLVCKELIWRMPSYGEPFWGCAVRGFATLQPGCTVWLDVLLGFGIVFSVAIIGPNGWRPQYWGFAIAVLVASMRGLSAIVWGDYYYVLHDPASIVVYWKGAGLATVLGGLLGVGFHYLLLRIRSAVGRRRPQV